MGHRPAPATQGTPDHVQKPISLRLPPLRLHKRPQRHPEILRGRQQPRGSPTPETGRGRQWMEAQSEGIPMRVHGTLYRRPQRHPLSSGHVVFRGVGRRCRHDTGGRRGYPGRGGRRRVTVELIAPLVRPAVTTNPIVPKKAKIANDYRHKNKARTADAGGFICSLNVHCGSGIVGCLNHSDASREGCRYRIR